MELTRCCLETDEVLSLRSPAIAGDALRSVGIKAQADPIALDSCVSLAHIQDLSAFHDDDPNLGRSLRIAPTHAIGEYDGCHDDRDGQAHGENLALSLLQVASVTEYAVSQVQLRGCFSSLQWDRL